MNKENTVQQFVFVVTAALLTACASAPQNHSASQDRNASTSKETEIRLSVSPGTLGAEEQKLQSMLDEGAAKLSYLGARKTIETYFDPIIAEFDKRYGNASEQLYCAHNEKEALLYMMLGVAKKRDALLIPSFWGDAFFFKGYAYLDIGESEQAKLWIEKAIALSPKNSRYLSERAYIDIIDKQWDSALKRYKEADVAANSFSDDDIKLTDRLVALRGMGYVLSETKRYDEAEAKYRECLKLDPNDEKSTIELEYIKEQRAADTKAP